jgi:DNA replication protein DnaC
MLHLCEQSNIPSSRWFPTKLSPDDCDYVAFCNLADIKDDIVNFIDKGSNLYLYSTKTGNGKTTWAIKLMLKYFNDIWAGNGFKCRGIFIHIPTFLTRMKNFNAVDEEFERIKTDLLNVDLVIWDDIASTELSSYDHSQLLTYVDQRILSEKSNIFTGNLGNPEITKALGTRLASRVWNSSTRIELKGSDKR